MNKEEEEIGSARIYKICRVTLNMLIWIHSGRKKETVITVKPAKTKERSKSQKENINRKNIKLQKKL